MKIAKLQSDYSPDTFMRIVKTDDSDISLAIYGKDEMKIAGFNGGGWLSGKRKSGIISAFDRIIDILNNETLDNDASERLLLVGLEELYTDFNLIGENTEVSKAFDFAYDKKEKSNERITLSHRELLASKFSSYIAGYLAGKK